MIQPGIVAISNKDKRILYRWASAPSAANAWGAVGRPTAANVWSKIQHALKENTGDASISQKNYGPSPPIPVFFLLLLAHGNFINIKSFAGTRGSEPNWFQRRAAGALAKVLGLVAATYILSPDYPLLVAAFGVLFGINVVRNWFMFKKAIGA
eukprot:TRINITY_DN52372_c0_g1_i1.p1 TRINITY_DN52372_c0_g1~~TRINITY_DN52372_c0_g1_i1.p1  ORF type:complete len:153 (-),score=29.64 TRINITY_DN52372_c0_g1_i1:532-990(-)